MPDDVDTPNDVNDQTNNDPKYSKLPLYRGTNRQLVGYAWVDTELLPWLTQLGPWYPDSYITRPPRIQVSFTDPKTRAPYQVILRLHRVVMILSTQPAEKRTYLCSTRGIHELVDAHEQLPKIRFRDGEVLNCTLGNISQALTKRGQQLRQKRTGLDSLYQLPSEVINLPVSPQSDPQLIDQIEQRKNDSLIDTELLKQSAEQIRSTPKIEVTDIFAQAFSKSKPTVVEPAAGQPKASSEPTVEPTHTDIVHTDTSPPELSTNLSSGGLSSDELSSEQLSQMTPRELMAYELEREQRREHDELMKQNIKVDDQG